MSHLKNARAQAVTDFSSALKTDARTAHEAGRLHAIQTAVDSSAAYAIALLHARMLQSALKLLGSDALTVELLAEPDDSTDKSDP